MAAPSGRIMLLDFDLRGWSRSIFKQFGEGDE